MHSGPGCEEHFSRSRSRFSSFSEAITVSLNNRMSYSDFVEAVLCAIRQVPIKGEPLLSVLDDPGLCWATRPATDIAAEFGVHTGKTIRQICAAMPGHEVHGFDSFRGLPSSWRPGYDAGMFSMGGSVPADLPSEVKLHVGWFDDTVPEFAEDVRECSMALIHIDCDIYSSTRCVLNALAPMIHDTVLVFDELYAYPGFEEHEMRAFYELTLARPDLTWTCLAGGSHPAAFRLQEA